MPDDLLMGPRRIAPWGFIPYHNAQWDRDREPNEYCPDCRGVLTKVERYFDYDIGRWVRARRCMSCGNRVWEQSTPEPGKHVVGLGI